MNTQRVFFETLYYCSVKIDYNHEFTSSIVFSFSTTSRFAFYHFACCRHLVQYNETAVTVYCNKK